MSEENGHAEQNGKAGEPNGGFFNAPQQCAGGDRHLRSDARLIGRMFSMGVVSDEQAEDLLRQGFVLAAAAAAGGRTRNYIALMKMLLAYCRLEQIERLKMDPTLAGALGSVNIENAQIVFNVPDNGRGPKRLEFDGLNGSDG
jgi:hypothetical protein